MASDLFKRFKTAVKWLVLLVLFDVGSQVTPDLAISNLASWLRHDGWNIPFWLDSKYTDTIVRWIVRSLIVGIIAYIFWPLISALIAKLFKGRPRALRPQDIVYAEWSAIKDGKLYCVRQTVCGEELSERVKLLFSAPHPVKLDNSVLEVDDPIVGPHKQLKIVLSNGQCYRYDEYSRLTIDSAVLIPAFEVSPNTVASSSGSPSSSSSSSSSNCAITASERADRIRQFLLDCNAYFKAGGWVYIRDASFPARLQERYFPPGTSHEVGLLKLVSEATALAPYLVQAGEDSEPLHLFCHYLASVSFEREASEIWPKLAGQLAHAAGFAQRNGGAVF